MICLMIFQRLLRFSIEMDLFEAIKLETSPIDIVPQLLFSSAVSLC